MKFIHSTQIDAKDSRVIDKNDSPLRNDIESLWGPMIHENSESHSDSRSSCFDAHDNWQMMLSLLDDFDQIKRHQRRKLRHVQWLIRGSHRSGFSETQAVSDEIIAVDWFIWQILAHWT